MSSTLTVLLIVLTLQSVTFGFVPPVIHKGTNLSLPSVKSRSKISSIATTSLNAVADDANVETINQDADAIFNVIDSDGNGFVSRKELIDHLSGAGYTGEVIDKIFNKMDKNNDGEISKQEFQKGLMLFAALRSAPGLGNYNSEFEKEIYEDADTLFQSADVNNDGEIDVSELKSYLDRKFSKFTVAGVENLFEIMDVNNDGKITKEELKDAFVRYSALRLAIGEGPNFK
mmetsp:Transcript_52415/g.61211  ORF Transcript_52415/g.61211 Transcript_52415/m.61211 type:complete len:230 (+) Transcript_52415:65-754(+)